MRCGSYYSGGRQGYSALQQDPIPQLFGLDGISYTDYSGNALPSGNYTGRANYSGPEKKPYEPPTLTKIDVMKMYGIDNSPDRQYSATQLAGPSTYSQLAKAGEGAAQPLYIGPALFFGGGGGLMHRRGPLYMGGKNGIGAGYSGAGCSAGKGSAAAGSSGGK